jgi:hypothetical protein
VSAPDAIQLNTVTAAGSPAALADIAMRGADLACRALSVQGLKAFEYTRRAAAHHEAGHAVINALDGIATAYCKVKRKPDPFTGQLGWIGFTQADAPWSVTPDTPPEDDCLQMRRMLAGWAAEILLEGDDLALGSSIDEALIAGNIAALIARKTGQESDGVFQGVMVGVLADLALHGSHVRAIAALLMRERLVRGPRLQRLLPPPCGEHPINRRYPEPLISRMNATMVAIAARMNSGMEGASK